MKRPFYLGFDDDGSIEEIRAKGSFSLERLSNDRWLLSFDVESRGVVRRHAYAIAGYLGGDIAVVDADE